LMSQMGSVSDKLTAAKITEVLSQAQSQAKLLKVSWVLIRVVNVVLCSINKFLSLGLCVWNCFLCEVRGVYVNVVEVGDRILRLGSKDKNFQFCL